MKERTHEQIVQALEASAGIVSIAAQKLGIHRNTLHRWMREDEQLAEAAQLIEEDRLDLAETGLIAKLKAKEWPAIQYYLTCKGKKRGYGFQVAVTGKDGGPVRTTSEPEIDFSKLTDDEIRQYLALVEKGNAANPDTANLP